MVLAIPKRKRDDGSDPSTKLKVGKNPRRAAPAPAEGFDIKDKTVTEIVAMVASATKAKTKRVVAARSAAAAKKKNTDVTQSELQAVWKEAIAQWEDGYSFTALSREEWGIFKRVMKANPLGESKTWFEFCSWVIANWTKLNQGMDKYFEKKGVKQEAVYLGSRSPSIRGMARHYKWLLQKYNDATFVTVEARVKASNSKLESMEKELAEARAVARVAAREADKWRRRAKEVQEIVVKNTKVSSHSDTIAKATQEREERVALRRAVAERGASTDIDDSDLPEWE